LAIHGSVAWIAQQTDSTGSLKRVDVSGDASGQVDDRVGGDLRDIASGDEGIWLLLTDETSNAAYEIDPQTGELLHRIETGSRGDGQIAVADGYVWVTNVEDKTLLQIDPDGSPTPIPSETPTDEETKDASPQPAEEADCTDIPFASLTGTMGLGSGANVGESLQGHEASNVVLHYSLSHGAFVDVVVGNPDYATGDPSEAFDVLGSEAILSEIKDGYMVTFGYKSCPFALLGYGMARAAVKEFAADLLFEGDPDMHNDAWALWPEPDPEQAYQTCLDSSGSDAGTGTELDEQQRELQARLESTAFVNDVLGWPGDSSMERDKGLEGGYGDDFVALIVTGPAGNRMEIVLRETVPGCWSVVSLNPADEVFTGASLSKQAGVLHVGFDPDSQNIKGDLDHMTIETASGSGIERRRLSIEEFKAGSPLTVGFERSGPSYFMILFQDAAGKVLNAKGYALPSGDVVAG
jgi:hypothetical protein